MSRRVRPPAVAGLFYPDGPGELAAVVDVLLAQAATGSHGAPAALISPHAGYVYSGPIAASAYARLAGAEDAVRRVVLVGPPHHVPVQGLAVSGADRLATPLGEVTVDDDARAAVLDDPAVRVDDDAHAPEHSLETQLPFLQRALRDRPVLPLLAGRADAATVAGVLERVWDERTLVILSTDLSHYHDLASARARDRRTADAILARDATHVDDTDACGARGLRGLLESARRRALDVEMLDLRTSADTAGGPDRVVGYGAFALTCR